MPKRILEDGRVVLTKDEFVNLMLREQKRRKLKRQREDLELYGDLEELDYSKNTVKNDFDVDRFIEELSIEAKRIINETPTNSVAEKVNPVANEVKKKTNIKANKKANTKVSKKTKNTSTITEKSIISEVIPTYEIKGISTKDGNEQLSFVF